MKEGEEHGTLPVKVYEDENGRTIHEPRLFEHNIPPTVCDTESEPKYDTVKAAVEPVRCMESEVDRGEDVIKDVGLHFKETIISILWVVFMVFSIVMLFYTFFVFEEPSLELTTNDSVLVEGQSNTFMSNYTYNWTIHSGTPVDTKYSINHFVDENGKDIVIYSPGNFYYDNIKGKIDEGDMCNVEYRKIYDFKELISIGSAE